MFRRKRHRPKRYGLEKLEKKIMKLLFPKKLVFDLVR